MDSALTDPGRFRVPRGLPFLYDSPQVAIHRRQTPATPRSQAGQDAGSASAVGSIELRRQVWHSHEEFS